jgi:hypothetical protein
MSHDRLLNILVAIERRSETQKVSQSAHKTHPQATNPGPGSPRNCPERRGDRGSFEAADFSKAYRFPEKYLASEIQGRSQSHRRLRPGETETKEPIGNFVKAESELGKGDEVEDEEPNDKTVPNFSKMLQIARRKIDEQQDVKLAIGAMSKYKFAHFVLLLKAPLLQLNAIYLLKASMTKLTKIWGEGPDVIQPGEVQSFWKYNVLNKQFEQVDKRIFETNLDAVAL